MRRRELMLLLGGAMTGARVVRAQQKAMPVIGFLAFASSGTAPTAAVFLQGLSETGYVEGQNVTIEYRYAEGHYDRLPALAADLVLRKVNVILASGDAATTAVKDATSTIPIVFISGDPVGQGLVDRLARPAATSRASASSLSS